VNLEIYMPIVTDPKKLAMVVAMKAAGVSDFATGKELNVSHTTVGRVRRHDDVKALIEATHRQLLDDNLDAARQNITDIIFRYGAYMEAGDTDNIKLSLKYSSEVLKSIGALPAQAPAVMVANIYNAEAPVMSPVVQAFLDKISADLAGPPDEEETID
jgi:hypothetical protein